ncbi:hypothetical protein P171DRAFT_433912 [Karstenula rhodostoma CBS 690.94]|uniref:Uncharacterized protein n=1 Tax=Karstenula rhodostoma CBS 690.94 TaxID=1392251 RepID=A0A9P4U9V8_9PLEO|nr:hypothetical protein P171DRAFT_433912 [Karstenula rhodostoma CBS 690.94]
MERRFQRSLKDLGVHAQTTRGIRRSGEIRSRQAERMTKRPRRRTDPSFARSVVS